MEEILHNSSTQCKRVFYLQQGLLTEVVLMCLSLY